MTTTPTTTLPDLDGFCTYYGVKVSSIGEDGDMLALGHHDPKAALAVFNAYAKGLGFPDLLDGNGKHLASNWKQALASIATCWAVLEDPPAGVDGWWIDYAKTVTAETPGAFPVTAWIV